MTKENKGCARLCGVHYIFTFDGFLLHTKALLRLQDSN